MKFFNGIDRKQIDITLNTFKQPCPWDSASCWMHSHHQSRYIQTDIPSGSFKIFLGWGNNVINTCFFV